MRHLIYTEMKEMNVDISEGMSENEILEKYDIDYNSLELVKVLMSGKNSDVVKLGHNRSLNKYIVGVKPRAVEWARDALNEQLCPKIRKARELFQEGRVEIVTEQTKDFTILYAIPRRIPAEPNKYFETEKED